MDTERSLWLRVPLITLGIASVVLSITLGVILMSSSSECDKPIRGYLFTLCLFLLSLGVPLLLVESFLHGCLKSNYGLFWYLSCLSLLITAIFVLQGVGLFMLSGDDECASDFTDGYKVSLAINGIFFIVSGILLGVFIAWYLKAIIQERNGYKNLEETSV